jgi:hypothetical protein
VVNYERLLTAPRKRAAILFAATVVILMAPRLWRQDLHQGVDNGVQTSYLSVQPELKMAEFGIRGAGERALLCSVLMA